MSKYKRIETQLRDTEALKMAMAELGVPFEYHEQPQPLYGYHGDARPERANIIVRRQYVGQISNDFGLEWDAASKTYRAHISEYDEREGYGPKILNRIKQRYAVCQAITLAKARGLAVVEQKDEHGVIRLKLAGYRR